MRPAYVRGLGCWTPGFSGAAAWCRGIPDESVRVPEGRLLEGSLRRRASTFTRMAVDALEQAAGGDLANLITVWATVHGEHAAAVDILEMMHRGEGRVSPTRFHNCVYNAASGQASIATGNRAPSTTLTGGSELVASALLEAFCWLQTGADDVAVVLADEPLVAPFDTGRAGAPLALALLLSARPEAALASLSGMRRESVTPVKPRSPFGDLIVSAGLPLLERVGHGRPGCVALELEGQASRAVWCVDVGLVAPRLS